MPHKRDLYIFGLIPSRASIDSLLQVCPTRTEIRELMAPRRSTISKPSIGSSRTPRTDEPAIEIGSSPDLLSPDDGTLTDQAYAEIEELIVTLRLPPGTLISEQVLAQKLSIGRTPIREALHRLAHAGLVLIMPRRGVMVSEINLRVQLDLLEMRREVERLMARLAAERATPDERAAFAQVSREMLAAAKNEDDIAFMRLDQQFNALMARTSRNEFAQRSMILMNALSRRFWYRHYQEVADLPRTAKLHAAVADAVAKRNATEAARASDRLVDYIEDFARKTLDR